MEYNDLDGYDESLSKNEIQKQLEKYLQNASAYAAIKHPQALKTEFSKIEKIVCEELDKAETNWTSLLWQISEKGIGEGLRQMLEEMKPLTEFAYNQAEKTLRFYNSAFSKLLTMAERKDFSSDDDGCYLRVA
jgi:hypothetical protein